MLQSPSRDGGRGKSDPLLANSSDENRAKNRRVTLKLVSEITETVALDKGGELPEFDAGPCGTGEEGIEIGSEESVPHYRYTASTREVGEHLVVDLKATVLDDVVDSAFGIGGYSRGVGGRGVLRMRVIGTKHMRRGPSDARPPPHMRRYALTIIRGFFYGSR